MVGLKIKFCLLFVSHKIALGTTLSSKMKQENEGFKAFELHKIKGGRRISITESNILDILNQLYLPSQVLCLHVLSFIASTVYIYIKLVFPALAKEKNVLSSYIHYPNFGLPQILLPVFLLYLKTYVYSFLFSDGVLTQLFKIGKKSCLLFLVFHSVLKVLFTCVEALCRVHFLFSRFQIAFIHLGLVVEIL